ncbi:LysR family transcriptional regulator [Clostridium chauvoei]|uniref:LysR family transcriptional regulator n=2 Tax=Clostridium chauvoei TaxID=46867 RepID=A0ABD4RI02_9CLOT|nr:LysR family transcriptional regulator [Clostridium chauvoei]ATD55454.1 LysR family transcriptional regulator [Clostridium chauvoei]ATD56873.1 LysR family transcriptional regulator [Clostridium chauvoei]MBX7280669.1 LysR family transcriptional regulator [Clostridium chauvoei]MBX7283153.1 LysR family transcriptional regulator [Clostridium chauvoei]MBX7285710.1 LysR family transcriptional regulator [Clostridium chauvoei]
MNFRKLKIFYETATCLNMTKVAKNMYISQPSISQSINELENELEVKLFDRIGKKLYLTHEGEIFLNYTRRILNLYDESTKILKDFNNNIKGKITIGASTTIGIYILPEIIKEFSSEFKDIEISLIIENTEHIEKLILENKIDFAYVEGSVQSDEINKEKVWEDELVFICGKNHKFKEEKIISGEKLAKEKFIMREDGSGTREHVENFLNNKNLPFNIFLELGNTEAIKRTVEANLGIGCISLITIEEKLESGDLNAFRLKEGVIKRDLLFIIHKDKFISNNMKKFMEFAEKNSI